MKCEPIVYERNRIRKRCQSIAQTATEYDLRNGKVSFHKCKQSAVLDLGDKGIYCKQHGGHVLIGMVMTGELVDK